MPLNQQNLNMWKEQAEIDYFSHFIKAWIPFNAWFRHNYPTITQEREVMAAIRTEYNVVRSQILPLLEGDDNDAVTFKAQIGLLQDRLSQQRIPTKRGELNFQRCYIGNNPKKIDNGSYRSVSYTVERDTPASNNGNNRVLCMLANTNGTAIFQHRQGRHDLDELRGNAEFALLSAERRSQAEARYQSIAPDLIVDLLNAGNSRPTNTAQTIEAGAFSFCYHPEYIFAGLVNVLYDLRCQLFHGEIVPNNSHNGVYEPAYFILRRFLSCL